ncbi:hypothetical protein L873DRAFT_1809956 [Choiromyces venosus 120613-1]|uniref:Uncharacterized protein n=1 Tax=Choiromyces venosus 120613-1 TaxID=1336337 RepID=A0A3N4JJG2_9PEZI|nr:hypothetical protein L873DRAFT_1809956 [Choiromyces venosus 120613-1]
MGRPRRSQDGNPIACVCVFLLMVVVVFLPFVTSTQKYPQTKKYLSPTSTHHLLYPQTFTSLQPSNLEIQIRTGTRTKTTT